MIDHDLILQALETIRQSSKQDPTIADACSVIETEIRSNLPPSDARHKARDSQTIVPAKQE